MLFGSLSYYYYRIYATRVFVIFRCSQSYVILHQRIIHRMQIATDALMQVESAHSRRAQVLRHFARFLLQRRVE
jgi:hypothetical protein